MLRTLTYPSAKCEAYLKTLENRISAYPAKLERYLKKIAEDVKKRGDSALLEYTERFDKVKLTANTLRIKDEEIERAYREVSEELLSAIRLAIKQVRQFHEKNLPQSWIESFTKGIIVGQVVRPVSSCGLYIPGGKGGETPLISTVIMTAVPAKIAGVPRLIMVSPPRVDGSLHPALLVSAKEAGVDEVYRVGGPWSIFALAYGTETIPKVDLICGPGNIYVTLAKKLVAFQTGIDFLAGPSEVVVVADGSANPKFVVWDLLAQAEHDPESLSILITPSKKLAKAVKNLLPKEMSILPRKEIAEKALKKHGAIIVVSSLDEAMELVNRIAPEHLELAVENPEELLFEVKNAGAVFLGHYTPEAMGDYLAGPNHVLPTMGLARFASALSADKFLKKINFLKYTKLAMFAQAKEVVTLANAESLFAHAQAVRVRLEENL